MRERINRLARGIVDAELPKLFLSPVKVEETLGSDTIYKRELYLSSENNLSIKGLAYSTHSRVRIASRSFGGLRNHIVYEVDTSWCENGDVIRGTINLVTNGGELEVSFLFCVGNDGAHPWPLHPAYGGGFCGSGPEGYGSGSAAHGI